MISTNARGLIPPHIARSLRRFPQLRLPGVGGIGAPRRYPRREGSARRHIDNISAPGVIFRNGIAFYFYMHGVP